MSQVWKHTSCEIDLCKALGHHNKHLSSAYYEKIKY